jgi:hypothetical protein
MAVPGVGPITALCFKATIDDPAQTRKVPREERTRAFVWDPISGSHQGQRPKWLH